ncbi:MAG: oligosaccharide flippase family protein [Anaerolineales bacterium]|nr:oligosaccharide flippase family protein [Anaerolineales bacterium]
MLRSIQASLQSYLHRFLGNPLIKRLLRNASYLFSAQTISAALSFAQGVLAARTLGIAGIGQLEAIVQFSSNINRLTSFRMGELVVSYVGEFSEQGDPARAAAVYKLAAFSELSSSLLAFVLVVFLAPWGARFFVHEPALADLCIVYGVSILANAVTESSTGLLQYFDRFKRLASVTILQSVLTLALISYAYFSRGSLVYIVLAYLAGKMVWSSTVSVVALVEARRQWGRGWWKTPLAVLTGRFKELFRFAFNTNITGTITLMTRDSETLWLAGFTSPIQVGYYKIAKAIMNILVIPVNPLISTTFREIAREAARKQWANVRYLLRTGSTIAALYTIPASLGLVVFGRYVIGLYGIDFLPTSYYALMILLAGILADNILYWNRTVLLPLGHPVFPTMVHSIGAVLKIAGTILLVPQFGALGMAGLLSLFMFGTATILLARTLRVLADLDSRVPQQEGA